MSTSGPRAVLMTNASALQPPDASTIQEVVGVRGEWRVQRDDIALLQQLVEYDVLHGAGPGPDVMGQHPTAEPSQSVDDRNADPSRPDHPDGQVAQFSSALVVQPEVTSVRAADDGLSVAHCHQHQHQRVVGNAVGRVGDVLDADAHAGGVLHVDVVVANASRGDVGHAGPAQREESRVGDRCLVTDADASVSECQVDGGVGCRCVRESRHDAEAGRQLPEQGCLVRLTSVDGDARGRDGRAGPTFVSLRCKSCEQSRERGVASTYEVFDMPAIWSTS